MEISRQLQAATILPLEHDIHKEVQGGGANERVPAAAVEVPAVVVHNKLPEVFEGEAKERCV